MRVLVIGGGGREHALAWVLAREAEVLCAPGGPGIAEDVECVPISVTDHEGLAALAISRQVDLAVVGPEDPLVAGLADFLRAKGVPTYGPGADGARLEGSKVFSKGLMEQAGVPTAAHGTFSDPAAASEFARSRYDVGLRVVVKANGNALGKGVIVCETLDSALDAIEMMLVGRQFGEAGSTVVVEDRLAGREFSLLTLVSGESYFSLPVAQDHKRVFDGDQGPNTGGMGAYTPVEWVSDAMVRETESRVVEPILRQMRELGIDFRGTLFSGLMVDGDVINCLEYNVRFGDPEIEALSPRIGLGFAQALLDCAEGRPITPPAIADLASVTVMMASPGYPASYPKRLPITVGILPTNSKVFHSGTSMVDGQLVTNGGRVLAVTGWGTDFSEAHKTAYAACGAIAFEGAHYRKDIGTTNR